MQTAVKKVVRETIGCRSLFSSLTRRNGVGHNRECLFKVKTSIKAATDKSAERQIKMLSNFDDTERDRKAKRMPKELKPLIIHNTTLTTPNIT